MRRKIINSVIKDTVTFIHTSDETSSKITELELTLMPGGSNFSHYHKAFTETFTAIDGALGLKLGGNEIKILQPNETYAVAPIRYIVFLIPTTRKSGLILKLHPGIKGLKTP